jgi:hypothetical protein
MVVLQAAIIPPLPALVLTMALSGGDGRHRAQLAEASEVYRQEAAHRVP